MNKSEFEQAIMQANVQGRVLRIDSTPWCGATAIYVHFYNLPKDVAKLNMGGGAEAENNRQMFRIDFSETKCKVEHTVNALSREYQLRGKTATPEKIAAYLKNHLEKVAREVEPKFTHSKP